MIGGLRDGLNLASKMTWKRARNVADILRSYQHSKAGRGVAIKGLPISISIEPTTSCNLRCPECPSGLRSFTRPTGMMEEKLYKKTIDELADTLLYLIFYFQGEPYLHPKLFELVQYAHDKGNYTATSTHAHNLTEYIA